MERRIVRLDINPCGGPSEEDRQVIAKAHALAASLLRHRLDSADPFDTQVAADALTTTATASDQLVAQVLVDLLGAVSELADVLAECRQLETPADLLNVLARAVDPQDPPSC